MFSPEIFHRNSQILSCIQCNLTGKMLVCARPSTWFSQKKGTHLQHEYAPVTRVSLKLANEWHYKKWARSLQFEKVGIVSSISLSFMSCHSLWAGSCPLIHMIVVEICSMVSADFCKTKPEITFLQSVPEKIIFQAGNCSNPYYSSCFPGAALVVWWWWINTKDSYAYWRNSTR